MNHSKYSGILFLALSAIFTSHQAVYADVIWTVDSTQSFLRLVIPNQPAKLPDGTPSGNLNVTNQGSNSGAWTSGNQAAIGGTLQTDFINGVSIQFLAGEHALVALNSANYAPDFDNWNAGTQSYSPPNGVDTGSFGGQLKTTATGLALIAFNDIYRFALRDVIYDLGSGVVPLSGNTFNANATTFEMTDGMMGLRARSDSSVPPALILPSYLDTPDALGFSISGTNANNMATITSQPGLLKLTLPINVSLKWSLHGNIFTGTAQGTIVATTVPEASSVALSLFGIVAIALVSFNCRALRKS